MTMQLYEDVKTEYMPFQVVAYMKQGPVVSGFTTRESADYCATMLLLNGATFVTVSQLLMVGEP